MIYERSLVLTPAGLRNLYELREREEIFSFQAKKLVINQIFRTFQKKTACIRSIYAGARDIVTDDAQRFGESNGHIHYKAANNVHAGEMLWIVDPEGMGLQEVNAVEYRIMRDQIPLMGFRVLHEPYNIIVNGFVCRQDA